MSLAANSSAASVPFSASPPTDSAVAEINQDEVAHMRRRLFRTLEDPNLPMVAIDCNSVSTELLNTLGDQFFSDADFRQINNLVLAIPDDDAFADTPTFDWIQHAKQTAFDNGFDEKVSWLLIENPEEELVALKTLVAQQGGQWHENV